MKFALMVTEKLINKELNLIFMATTEIYIGVAVFLGATIPVIWQLGRSVAKLEVRMNKIVEEKKALIDESYRQAAEKIVKRFESVRKVSEELQQELEEISYVKYRLNESLPDELQDIGNKVVRSIPFGILSVIFLIIFAYSPSLSLGEPFYFWFQMFILLSWALGLIKYMQDGISQLSAYRKWETIVNKIERSNTFDKLYELL